MFKLNDKVKSKYLGIGEIVLIENNYFIIGWNEYVDGLMPSDTYDEFRLPLYDNRFYGTYDNKDLQNYQVQLYTIENEIKDIDEEINILIERKKDLLLKLNKDKGEI